MNKLNRAPQKYSPTMRKVIDKMRTHGDHLVRCPGGFWTTEPIAFDALGHLAWWCGTSTVNALVGRGVAVGSSPEGRAFPTRIDLTERGKEIGAWRGLVRAS